jgi:hypothetical protein
MIVQRGCGWQAWVFMNSKELIAPVSISPLFEIAHVLVRLDHIASPHRKRGSQHRVSGCEILRSLSHCWLRLAHCAGEGVGDAGAWVSSAM